MPKRSLLRNFWVTMGMTHVRLGASSLRLPNDCVLKLWGRDSFQEHEVCGLDVLKPIHPRFIRGL